MVKDDRMQFIYVDMDVGSGADGELDINTGIDNPFLSGYIMHIHEVLFQIDNQRVFAANSRKICALATQTGLDLAFGVIGENLIAGYGLMETDPHGGAGQIIEVGTKYWRADQAKQVIPYAGSKLYFLAEQTASASVEKFRVRIGYTLEKATKDRIIEALELWNMPAQ